MGTIFIVFLKVNLQFSGWTPLDHEQVDRLGRFPGKHSWIQSGGELEQEVAGAALQKGQAA